MHSNNASGECSPLWGRETVDEVGRERVGDEIPIITDLANDATIEDNSDDENLVSNHNRTERNKLKITKSGYFQLYINFKNSSFHSDT